MQCILTEQETTMQIGELLLINRKLMETSEDRFQQAVEFANVSFSV